MAARFGPVFMRGAVLVTASSTATYVLSFASLLVLARLLSPSQFGAVALATAIAEFVSFPAGLSMPAALLRESDSEVQATYSTVFWMTMVVDAAIAVLGIVAAIVLAATAGEEIALLFLAVLGGRLVAVHALNLMAEVERSLRYRRFAVALAVSQVLSLAVTLGLAFAGAGVWALAARDISFSLISFVVARAVSRWHASRHFDRRKARELFTFGIQMLGSRIGDMMFHKVDNVFVGALSGTRELGLYAQAYTLSELSNRVASPVLSYLPLNLYAKIQGEQERTQRVYDLITYWLVRFLVPFGVVILVLPGDALSVLLGSEWAPAADMLRALACYGLLLPLFEHVRVLLVANGRVTDVLRARALQLGLFLPLVPVGVLLFDGTGAGYAVAAAMVVGTVSIVALARPLSRFRVSLLAAPLVGAVLSGAATELAAEQVEGSPARLAVGVATMVIVYTATLLAVEGRLLRENLRYVRTTLRTRDPSPVWPETADAVAASPRDPVVSLAEAFVVRRSRRR